MPTPLVGHVVSRLVSSMTFRVVMISCSTLSVKQKRFSSTSRPSSSAPRPGFNDLSLHACPEPLHAHAPGFIALAELGAQHRAGCLDMPTPRAYACNWLSDPIPGPLSLAGESFEFNGAPVARA